MIGMRNEVSGDDFTNEDYREFESKLFSSVTSPPELKHICKTLAHLPSPIAQELLNRFMRSERANEVETLDINTPGTDYYLLLPDIKQDTKDELREQVVKDLANEIAQLKTQLEETQVLLIKKEIECDAIRELIQECEVASNTEIEQLSIIADLESCIEGLRRQIRIKDKIIRKLTKPTNPS